MLGETATEEQIEAYRQKIGYYDPLWQQYLNFVRDLARGDLGDSLRYHEPVNDLLAERFPVTVVAHRRHCLFRGDPGHTTRVYRRHL